MSNKSPILVGMDCGSGNVATVMETNGFVQVRLTPSYVRFLPGAVKETESNCTWITKGVNGQDEAYVVQPKAVSAVDTRTPDYQLSAACRVLVVNALNDLGLSGRKVIIADTLPANQYYDDNNAVNRHKIELKRKSLMADVRNAKSSVASPDIVDVHIMPEAVTAYNAALYTKDGELNPLLQGARDVVIVDIGRYTNDIAHFDCETYTLYARETTDRGAHILLQGIRQMMIDQSDEVGIPVDKIRAMTLDDIDVIARSGYYGSPVEALKNKRIDLDHIIAAAASTYASEIKYKLGVVVPQLASADALVIVGGGAHFIGGLMRELSSFVSDWHDNVVIPHQPESALARGAYLALRAMQEEENSAKV